ncbi:MAG TPA: hypothetical protein VFC13_26985 [Actinomycetes bacterium]|nr:hypothetical protein [Actinomycetes bacterium]
MATDRDEQVRQQQELEEIRRSFAEMGARMGSLFEPAEPEEDDQPEPSTKAEPSTTAGPPALPPAKTGSGRELAVPTAPAPPPARPAGPAVWSWPRWWLVGAVVLLLLAGTGLGYLLPRDGGGPEGTAAPAQANTATTPPAPQSVTSTGFRTRTTVPEVCLDTARLGDEVIARLIRNIRDERLSLALRDYTIASQACRKEASP